MTGCRRALYITVALALFTSCGPEEALVLDGETVSTVSDRCPYIWREGDGWAFLAWALDLEGGAETLAIRSGYSPSVRPQPGDTVSLPLSEELYDALNNRLEAARLVREATEALQERDTLAVREILQRAIQRDTSWSIPVYNLSLIVLRQEGPEEVIQMLRPIAHKYDAALLQSEIAWHRGETDIALRQLEICLMDDTPPFEVLAAAALIYTVTGHYYQASNIWREILSSPEADSAIRLMALEYAILQEERGGNR